MVIKFMISIKDNIIISTFNKSKTGGIIASMEMDENRQKVEDIGYC